MRRVWGRDGVPAIAFVTKLRAIALAAAMLFAAFVIVKGVPTLRHDWTWPIDRPAIPSFWSASVNGWLSDSLGTANPHPTTYLIALPIVAAMWLLGPLAALGLFAATIGYACMRCVAEASSRWESEWPAALGIGLFALFNPWVYNEVVAGHLVMVLAYAGLIGLFAEMLRGRDASSVRLALWIALIETQLQLFIVALLALVTFALATRKWLPALIGTLVALPSIIGLVAERGTLLRIPYVVTWQTNQSVAPLPLLGLGGYFPGYADRLGIVASVAVWIVLALALASAIVMRRRVAARYAIAAAALLYVAILGVHGPIAAPYAWIVRNVPESGVFRELYDLAGAFAALLSVLACAATARIRPLGYVALSAGVALPLTWALAAPSDLWIGARAYPHPAVVARPFTRIALLPAFQPLGLRRDGGDGADPDVYVYPGGVPALNEYFPAYPVDMALARYEQSGDDAALRVLGVAEIVPRPWLVSRTHGGVGLAASSLAPRTAGRAMAATRRLDGAMPLLSECATVRVVDLGDPLGPCDVFFGDAAGYAPVRPIRAPSDSIDSRTAWIDARLAFAESPELAQAIGGALTESNVSLEVEPNSWLLAYVRGVLLAANEQTLVTSHGSFAWVRVPAGVTSVKCSGLCELVAQTQRLPRRALHRAQPHLSALEFRRLAPWLYVVTSNGNPPPFDSVANRVLRFNERYDSGWAAFDEGRALAHVRIGMSVNGWFLGNPSGRVVLVQVTALLQLLAEIVGVLCVLWLLKALPNVPTKRVR